MLGLTGHVCEGRKEMLGADSTRMRKAEGGRRKAEGGRRKAEGDAWADGTRMRKAEGDAWADGTRMRKAKGDVKH